MCVGQRQAAQCVGRVIRSKADYGMMIFADKRYPVHLRLNFSRVLRWSAFRNSLSLSENNNGVLYWCWLCMRTDDFVESIKLVLEGAPPY